MPLILPARTLDSSFNIDNSLRFNRGDSPRLERTPSSATNRNTFTISFWFKRSIVDERHCLFTVEGDSDSTQFELVLHQNNYLLLGLNTYNILETDMLFRDTSAFYHVVLAMDTTQGSSDNRTKLYVNGQRLDLSGISRANNKNSVTSNYTLGVNNTNKHGIGVNIKNTNNHMAGYFSEFNFIDGSQKAPTDFGETNDNGVWIPKAYDGSYGTNGFFLEFKQSGTGTNASGMGADTSGNTNHFSVTNLTSTDQTTDTPTNNFCTLNPLDNHFQAATFAEGNTKITTNASNYSASSSTIGVANGKWYFEAKATDVHDSLIGVSGQTETSSSNGLGQNANQVGYLSSGNARKGGSDTSTGYASYTDNDIIGVALDIDNSKIYFSKNGTYQASGDPANNSNGFALTAVASTSTGFYTPSVGDNGSSAAIWEMNFGNAPFSISSGNADGNGYGNFEYAVPSGFYSLCTKNLAEYG